MISDKLRQLEATKAKVVELEKSVAAELQKKLSSLPETYGFADMRAFIKALKAAGKMSGRTAKTTSKRRTRAKINDETRAAVKKLAESGKTGAEIAKAMKISLPSVHNIKKALGLVKARK